MILTCYAHVEKVMLKHNLFEESNDDLADAFFQMAEKRIVLRRGRPVDEIQKPAKLRRNILRRAPRRSGIPNCQRKEGENTHPARRGTAAPSEPWAYECGSPIRTVFPSKAKP